MLYCSFEPGLFILQGLHPHETNKAFAVLRSLITHKNMMDQARAVIPMTRRYIDRIYNALQSFPISNPPLEKDLRMYIIAALAKMSTPPLVEIGIDGTILNPEITSDWIDDETRRIWLDSLCSAIFDLSTDGSNKLSTATWYRQDIPSNIIVSNPILDELSGTKNQYWEIPVLTDKLDWEVLLCIFRGWPIGIDSTLIDSYAKKNLGIPLNQLVNRKSILFEPACYREIVREADPNLRNSIIEVIACRAYNRVKPEHHDETHKTQRGVRRVYVRKMSPAVRLHYTINDESITYILYSSGEHDRGL